jgi:hypothetical protein
VKCKCLGYICNITVLHFIFYRFIAFESSYFCKSFSIEECHVLKKNKYFVCLISSHILSLFTLKLQIPGIPQAHIVLQSPSFAKLMVCFNGFILKCVLGRVLEWLVSRFEVFDYFFLVLCNNARLFIDVILASVIFMFLSVVSDKCSDFTCVLPVFNQ